MKGIVEKRVFPDNSKTGYGFIRGEDKELYYFDGREVENCKPSKLLTYNIVWFEVDEKHAHGDMSNKTTDKIAIEVNKIGHGKRHPYVKNLGDIKDYLEHINMDKNQRRWYVTDINKMIKYFSMIEDYEQCKSINMFD